MEKNDKMPLISIIIPIYNAEKFLNKCLDAITKQTYKNIDIILINDGSIDESEKICKSFCQNDKRILYYSNKLNKGAAASRNIGMKLAKGKYICFVDADDLVELNYVEYLYDLISKNNCDLAIANFCIKKNNKSKIINSSESDVLLSQEECLKRILMTDGITVSLCSKMYKKEIFQSIIFPEGYMYEDDATIYDIILNSKRIFYGSKVIYSYVIRENSVMTSKFSNKRLILLEYSNLMDDHISKKYPKLKPYIEKKKIDYLFSLMRQMVLSDLDNFQLKKKNEIRIELKKNSKKILFNSLFSLKEKIAIVSLILGERIFKLCWELYLKIKF